MAENDVIGTATIDTSLAMGRAEAQANAFFNKQRKLNADFSAFTPLGRIAKDASQVERSLEAANARVIAFGASASIFALVGAGFRKLVTDSVNVEKTLLDINVILGASASRLKDFSASLFEVASNTGSSFEDVGKAAKEFSRQGLSLEDTLKRTNAALVLTRLSGLDSAKSVTTLTTAINSFNREALTQESVVNKLANVDAKFAVSSEDLANALTVGGAAAQAAGVSFNEYLAIITSVKQTTGQSGNQIANALKGIFVRTGRSDTLDELEAIGIAVRDAAGKTLPMVQILQNLANVQDNLTDSQKSYITDLTAGTYRVNQLKAALSDVSKVNGIYSRSLKVAGEETNAAFERNEALNKSLSAQANAAKQNLTKISASIGTDLFGPVLTEVFAKINEIGKNLNGESVGKDLGQSLVKGLGSFLAGPGLIIIGALGSKILGRFAVNFLEALRSINKIGSQLDGVSSSLDKVISKSDRQVSQEREKLGLIQSQNAALQKQATIPSRPSASSPIAATINPALARITQGGGSISRNLTSPYNRTAPGTLGGRIQPPNINLGASSSRLDDILSGGTSRNVFGQNLFNPIPNRLNRSGGLFGNIPIPNGALNRNNVRNRIYSNDNLRAAEVESERKSSLGNDFKKRFSASALDSQLKEIESKKAKANAILDEVIKENGPADRRSFAGARNLNSALFRTRNVRGTGAGLGLGLGASILGSSIGGGTGDAISGVGNAVGSGAAIASLSPNAIGVAAGALVTSFQLLKVAVDSASDSISNRNKDDAKKIADNQTQLSNADEFSRAFAKLKEDSRLLPKGDPRLSFAQAEFRDTFAKAPPSLLRRLPNQNRLLDNSTEDFNTAKTGFDLEKTRNTNRRVELQKIRDNERKDIFGLINQGYTESGVSNILKSLNSGNFGQKSSNEDLDQAKQFLSDALQSSNLASKAGGVDAALSIKGFGIPERDVRGIREQLLASPENVINKLINGLEETIDKIREVNNLIVEDEKKTNPKGVTFDLNKVTSEIGRLFTADSLRRSQASAKENASFDSRIAINESLNDARSNFRSPIDNISQKFNSDREKLENANVRQIETVNDSLRAFAESLKGNISAFSAVADTRESLSSLISSTATSDNPLKGLEEINKILKEQANNKDALKSSEGINSKLNEANRILEGIKTTSEITQQKLAALEVIAKATALGNKLQNNFGGANALSTKQDLSEISQGRKDLFRSISDQNDPRAQANKAFELRYSSNPENTKRINRAENLRRSDSVGRGILSSVDSGELPSNIEIEALRKSNPNKADRLSRYLETQRGRLKNSFENNANNRINESAGSVISDLQSSIGNQYAGSFQPESIFQKASESASAGNLQEVEKQLRELLRRSSPEKRGAISEALSQIEGLNSQKELVGLSADIKSKAAIPDKDNGPLSKTGLIEALSLFFKKGGADGQLEISQKTPDSKEELRKALQTLTDSIKNGKIRGNEEISDAVGATVGDAVRSNSTILAKVDVAVRNRDSNGDGFLSSDEMKEFQKKMEQFIEEYFKSGGNPPPRTPIIN